MKKGFTLLELIVVVIILGVLAILGFTQYATIIEKSRGAEAKIILGTIRTLGIGYYLEYGSCVGFAPIAMLAHIGNDLGQIPGVCRESHWFSYSVVSPSLGVIIGTATRCASGGKPPQGISAAGATIILTSDLLNNLDTWGGTGGY
ncbi:MAG TPA: prepilin-type N-terminal cleavage/methylation domain-containing protein [Patescibacteria group bacterium]|nr:prepilin-type N-terminal cleavage/methylation domain-containing protein [Patescibacteria group bacterium]